MHVSGEVEALNPTAVPCVNLPKRKFDKKPTEGNHSRAERAKRRVLQREEKSQSTSTLAERPDGDLNVGFENDLDLGSGNELNLPSGD